MQLEADALQQVLDLGTCETGWKFLKGFDEVVGLDTLVSIVRGRGDLEQWTGLKADNLGLRARVRFRVTTSQELQDVDATKRGRSDTIPD